MISLSKARLDYNAGMHLTTLAQEEFQIGKDWFRVEAWKRDDGRITYSGYTTIGTHWRESMTEDDPVDKQTEVLRVMRIIGNRLAQRKRIAAGELQLS